MTDAEHTNAYYDCCEYPWSMVLAGEQRGENGGGERERSKRGESEGGECVREKRVCEKREERVREGERELEVSV